MSNLSGALSELRLERSKIRQQLEKLDEAISALETISGSSTSGRRGKRVISAASRRKMALAQRARWAKVRESSSPGAKPSASLRKPLSIAARRKIAAAQRARWAKQKQAA